MTTTDPATGAGLLEYICAHPDDIGARLRYADWLDDGAQSVPCGCDNGWLIGRIQEGLSEDGRSIRRYRCDVCHGTGFVADANGLRAEFIRTQIELASHPQQVEWLKQMPVEQWSGSPSEGGLLIRLDRLHCRERELAKKYISDRGPWNRPILDALGLHPLRDDFGGQWYWSRGFIESITTTWADWHAHAAAIRAATPIREVTLTDEPKYTFLDNGNCCLLYCNGEHWIPRGEKYDHSRKGIIDTLLKAEYGPLIDFHLPRAE